MNDSSRGFITAILMLAIIATTTSAVLADAPVPDRLAIDPGECISHIDYAQVVDAEIRRSGSSWTVSATVRHADSGEDHYADLFVAVDPRTMRVLGERVLWHPHVHEQPFTRTMTGLDIPDGVDQVLIVARCNVHGFGGCGTALSVPR